MKDYDEKQEDRINALFDGGLSARDAERLKEEASDDRDLARAIVEAYQLRQAMGDIGIERAPASLTRRLKAIPREQKPRLAFNWLQPRWAGALAIVPLLFIVFSLMQPKTPSAAEVARARQELAIAFSYIDKAGLITGREIESAVGHTTANAVTDSVNRAIKSQKSASLEKKA